jgi:hypothetical protein
MFSWFCDECIDPQNTHGHGERRNIYHLSAEVASWNNEELLTNLRKLGLKDILLDVVLQFDLVGADFDDLTFEVLTQEMGLFEDDAEYVLNSISELSKYG